MNVTDLTGLGPDAVALAAIGATAFGETEVQLLQQFFITLAVA